MKVIKVIENKYVENQIEQPAILEPKYPKEDSCEHCGSIFEYDAEDVEYGEFGCGYTTCPCCGKKTFLDDEEIELTIDNLKYPIHFYHTSLEDGAVDVSDVEIKKYIKIGIEYLHNNKDEFAWMTEIGTMFLSIYRFNDEREFSIIVSKDYYETDIHYSLEDYFYED